MFFYIVRAAVDDTSSYNVTFLNTTSSIVTVSINTNATYEINLTNNNATTQVYNITSITNLFYFVKLFLTGSFGS